ncbi:hypothetical protein CRENBAI_005096 [Crenichthys baileyi]|uniref:Integrase catalytic domain-containing protein n=1 Tax=Crenichthys baileyi TaxID=28760 RepID=A0AAV9S1F2_9TELE
MVERLNRTLIDQLAKTLLECECALWTDVQNTVIATLHKEGTMGIRARLFRGYRPLLAVRHLRAPPVLVPHEAITHSF